MLVSYPTKVNVSVPSFEYRFHHNVNKAGKISPYFAISLWGICLAQTLAIKMNVRITVTRICIAWQIKKWKFLFIIMILSTSLSWHN